MTIRELINRLEEYAHDVDDDAEVRLMTQSSYPFENEALGLTDDAAIAAEQGDAAGNTVDPDPDADAPRVIYIVEGAQICYGSKAAWATVR